MADVSKTKIAQILSGIISYVKNPEGDYLRKGLLTLTGTLSQILKTSRRLTSTIRIFSGVYSYIKDVPYGPLGFLRMDGLLTRIFSIPKVQNGIINFGGSIRGIFDTLRTYSGTTQMFSGIVKFAELNTYRKGILYLIGNISIDLKLKKVTLDNNRLGFSGVIATFTKEILYYGPPNP